MDSAGNVYGTTNADGAHNKGNVFKLSTVREWLDLYRPLRLYRRQRRRLSDEQRGARCQRQSLWHHGLRRFPILHQPFQR